MYYFDLFNRLKSECLLSKARQVKQQNKSGTEVTIAGSSQLRPGPLLFTNVKKVDRLELENE